MTGKLIVFEGTEGCGKTTQLARSRQWLSNSRWLPALQKRGVIKDLILTREPGGTTLGTTIRQLLLNPASEAIHDRAELLLYAADRAQHVEGFLRPHLAANDLILCDRYTDSTIAYQGYGRGLDFTLIGHLNQIATQGLQSDLTLWLDLDVETGLARMQQRGKGDSQGSSPIGDSQGSSPIGDSQGSSPIGDRIEQADVDFHRRVRHGFAHLAQTEPQRFVRVDASGSELQVAERIEIVLSESLSQWFNLASYEV
ncbi:dTMP kinase [Myxacorys almedinensis]|uniref:Thymidylate kinase n=1 Tax=Myxacorys almedinensis A TaxID=2690445 RepID=A0A8J8CKJ7_9CYAN|nr:dTMP kinase [Myxacorys almedinensis]NDJ19624.1 dTMP kinase [Myxacorys almedinensis A]